MKEKLQNVIFNSYLLRPVALYFIRKLGSYKVRVTAGVVDRPNYGYCVYNAALLAKRMGYKRISVLEFGVAGGNGLVNLEYHAGNVSKLLGIEIDIFGFDSGEGLPHPESYKDLPYQWKKGFFKMDVPKLQARLKKARLILGDLAQTSKDFFEKYDPAPVGAVIHDLDFYSSTVVGLKMFEADQKYYLPRTFCYFDDTVGTEMELYNDYTGERLAINEFNQAHDKIKLGLPYHLLAKKFQQEWYHQIWICHFFNHSRYNDFVSAQSQELGLN